MPIEFYCPGCGNLMRTPDETAGRKGRCPTCQTKVAIPLHSVKAGDEPRPSPEQVQTVAPQRPQPTDKIQFNCGSCQKSLAVPAANAGKKGQCPHCGAVMSIPLTTNLTSSSPAKASPAAASQPTRWKERPKPSTTPAASRPAASDSSSGGKIEFACSSCRKVVRVGAAAAGQKGRCPNCKSVIQIPLQSTVKTQASKPVAAPKQRGQASSVDGLTPINSGPTSKGDAGLAPLDSGLTPLGGDGLTPIDSGLEPLDAGLTPLDNAGAVSSGTPQGHGGATDPLGVGGMGVPVGPSSNQYAGAAPAITTPARQVHGSKQGPSGALITLGVLVALIGAGNLVTLGMALVMEDVDAKLENIYQGMDAQDDDERKSLKAFALAIRYGSSLIMAAGSAISIAGGIQTTRQKSRGLCLAGSVFAMLPCGCCCILGIPVGIWGMIMLSQDSVKRGFR